MRSIQLKPIQAVLYFGVACLAIAQSSCQSAYRKMQGEDTNKVFSRIYVTDFESAWQSTLDAVKSLRLDVSNREGGYLQTRWTENSSEKKFTDSYGTQNAYLKAQYRFRISIAKGFFNGEPTVKVTLQKDQLIQRDVLEGWKPVESDGVEEKTLLYRIGRLITLKMKRDQLEAERTNSEIEKSAN